jgi:hypothetical protein
MKTDKNSCAFGAQASSVFIASDPWSSPLRLCVSAVNLLARESVACERALKEP